MTLINLNEKQASFLSSTEAEKFFISGVGGGKSFTLGQHALACVSVPGSLGLICAPTNDVLKNSTFKAVQMSWEAAGVYEEVHYVVNKRPPANWKVQPYTKLSNARIVTFVNGSYIILSSLVNFNTVRGAEYDWIGVDEFRDVNIKEVRKVLLGRMRGQTFTHNSTPHMLRWYSTPPDNPTYIQTEYEKNPDKFVFGSTYDNIANLPEGYIENMLENYDPITIQREVYAQLVMANVEKPFAYCYEPDKHRGELDQDWDYLAPLYLSFDFNMSPMTCIAGQLYLHEPKGFYVIKEFREMNCTTADMCGIIASKLDLDKFPSIIITGDATGRNRSTSQTTAFASNYNIIKDFFKRADMQVPRSNPTHGLSRQQTNSLLSHHNDFLISKSGCPYLHEDLVSVEITDQGKIDKSDSSKGHLLDCFRYLVNLYYILCER